MTDEIFMTIKKMETLSVSSSSRAVGIALATSVGAEEITVAIAKALASRGITNVAVTLVPSPSVLPFLVKQMTETCDVIIAIGTLLPDEHFMAEVLIESLIQTGLTAKTPVVPAIISPASLLELKASLPHLCDGWSNSISSLLALGVIPPTPIASLMVRY
jgi:2-keto-3-deoxy-6-phosphogluconate aldolase